MVYECGNIEVVAPTGADIMSPAADVKLVSCSAPSQVNAGADFTVDFTIDYVGTSDSFFVFDRFAASVGEDTTKTKFGAIKSGLTDFSATLTAPDLEGAYDIDIMPVRDGDPATGSSVFCTSIQVEQTFDSGAVSIADCSTSADIGVATIDEITASASIRNDNSVAAEVTVDFTGGGLEDTVRTLISPTSTEDLSSTFIFSTEGEKTIEVFIDSATRTGGSVT